MILDPTTEVTLYDLLSQREHAFVEVYEYEQRIKQIMGDSYSAFQIPELPSLATKKKKAAKKAKKRKRKIRRLKPETEDAYLVKYEYHGEMQNEVLREYRLVQLLVKNDIPNLAVKTVSSIIYTTNNEFDIVQKLYSCPTQL